MGKCRDFKALRPYWPRSAFWPRGHKSGVILSLSLVTVVLNSAQPCCLRLDLLCHNCGLVLGLILLALASVGFYCLGLKAVANGESARGGTAPARSECPSPLVSISNYLTALMLFLYISNTVKTGMVVVSQCIGA